MHPFVIRRRGIAGSVAELDAALTRLRTFEERVTALQAQWIRSYAVREADGRIGLACVFQAPDALTLRRHADAVALPAEEIVPVAGVVRCRDDAHSMVHLIRRRGAWNAALELGHRTVTARRVADEEMTGQVSWIRSYVVRERDGRWGMVCIYQGVSARALTEHAARSCMPADEVTEVIGHVAYRDDPHPQSTLTGAVPV